MLTIWFYLAIKLEGAGIPRLWRLRPRSLPDSGGVEEYIKSNWQLHQAPVLEIFEAKTHKLTHYQLETSPLVKDGPS